MTDIKILFNKSNILQQIPFEKYKKDFKFIVNGKEYEISRFEADIISPTIRKLHFIDESIDEFVINTNEQFPNCEFSDFLSLLSFEPQTIEKKNQKYFKFLLSSLGNVDLRDQIILKTPETLTTKNIIEIIQQKSVLDQNDSIDEEIKFAAHHFTELNQEELKELDIEIIERIIQNDQFQIENEDLLLNFINELYIEDKSRSYLFENVSFSNVSKECLSNFLHNFNYNDLNGEIWKSIINQILDIKTIRKHHKYTNIIYEEKELNGIIKYLTDKTGGNIHDNGTIKISASSTQKTLGINIDPRNLLDFNHLSKISMWTPDNEENAELLYDFIDRKIKLTNYTLHTPSNKTDDYPKCWSVECSNDLQSWILVDDRKNEDVMNGFNVCHTFKCQNQLNDYFRYIKITSKGPCWDSTDRYYFDISAVEFYGSIKE